MSKARLTEGPVGRQLVDLTVPMLFGIATMMGQTVLDAWFLGQVGTRELAAHGFGFPIIMIVTSVAIGLGAGTSSVVARAVGADDHRRARRLSTDSLILSFLVTVVVAVIGVATIDPLFRLLGAPEDMLPMIRSFMTILYAGVPFIVVGMVGMSAMRAIGNAALPGKILVAGAFLHVLIAPVLIFGLGAVPALGLDGAAVANFISRGAVFAAAMYFLVKHMDLVSTNKPKMSEWKSSCGDILHVGIPAAGTNAIVPIGAAVVTAMVAQYGPDAVAGFGVASRIENLVLVFFYAMSSIIGPFVGQNLAAGREDRIHRALKLCTFACLGIGLASAVLLLGLSWVLPGLFSESAEVQQVTRLFLWIVPISYGTYGMVMVMNATFNGVGYPLPGVWVSTGRVLLLYVPIAALLGSFFGLLGIFVAYSIANIISGFGSYIWATRIVRQRCATAAAT